MKTYTWEDAIALLAKISHEEPRIFLQNNHPNYEGKRRSNKIHKVAKSSEKTRSVRTKDMQRKEPTIQRREGTSSTLPSKDAERGTSS